MPNLTHLRLSIAAIVGVVVLLATAYVIILQLPSPPPVESNFQKAFFATYPGAQGTALGSCNVCHTVGAELNRYGTDFAAHGHSVQGIELLDSDRDGFRNVTEIANGTLPGVETSFPLNRVSDTQSLTTVVTLPQGGVYKLIGWNDLGMHCMGPSYANLSILPPYNTMWAQLILQGATPQLITQGVTVEYAIENNTYSAGKTNFWQYDRALFGVNLPLNVGLAGKGLTGTMDVAGDHFVAAGIPVTAFYDGATPVPNNWAPYQIAHLVAKDSATGLVLAETRPVIPVSEEMNCNVCHGDGKQDGIATGSVETNILTKHDREEGTHLMQNRPVLCQECHADNALGLAGNPELPNLSRAIHEQHKVENDLAAVKSIDPENLKPSLTNEGTNNCYLCHPGVKTQCLRDVMWEKGVTCTDCHGTTADVANASRRPWIDLPRCETCHGEQFAENPNTLYRNSTGHGGLYCEACHGSPHAILPSTQPNDNIQNIALQGYAGTLKECSVCHGTVPSEPGPHGLPAGASPTPTVTPSPTAVVTPTPLPQCSKLPPPVQLLAPANKAKVGDRNVSLDWSDANCAASYRLVVRIDSPNGSAVLIKKKLKLSEFGTPALTPGHSYYWNVTACNKTGCSAPSATQMFRVKKTAAVQGR